jgi:hypothetical protein
VPARGVLGSSTYLRFLARATRDPGAIISDESRDLAWRPLEALPENCDDDLRRLADQAARPARE